MSMLVVSRARRGGVAITARQVFEQRTPAALARVATTAERPAVESRDVAIGEVPLTPVMHEMIDQAGPAALTGRFCQSMLVTAPARMTLDPLVPAVQAVLDRHDVLRARLRTPEDGGWALVVPPAGSVRAEKCVGRVDVRGLGAQALADTVAAETRDAVGRLDPRAGVMVRVVWFDAGPDTTGRLLVVVHHLVVDGVSWRVLVPDLAVAYSALAAGREPVLEPVGVSFRRWAETLAAQAAGPERAGELAVWTRMLEGPDALLGDRPLDARRDTVAAGMRHVEWPVPAAVTEALLTRVPAAFHAGVDDVLLAGLVAAVAEWRHHQGGLLVHVEGHGREPLTPDMDLTRTVGWFTSMYPVRLDPCDADLAEVRAGGPAAGHLVKRIKEQLRAVPADGLGFGLLRHLNPGTAPALSALPVPQIGFNYLGRFPADRGGGTEWQPAGETAVGGAADAEMAASHTLEAGGLVRDLRDGPELSLTLMSPAGLLSADVLQELAAGWAATLTGLVTHTTDPGSGGHTPSDFTLVALAQDEIDEFEIKLAAERGAR
jgi:non-ribosomal peptide synthase protein (TIGR01720 family)